MQGYVVSVGYIGGVPHTSSNGVTTNESVADIARKLSFGVQGVVVWQTVKTVKGEKVYQTHAVNGIPARPHLEEGIMYGQYSIQKAIEAHFKKVLKGDPTGGLDRVGAECVAGVQEYMTDGQFIPNSFATIQAKGSDSPLIDTGEMRASVTYLVDKI